MKIQDLGCPSMSISDDRIYEVHTMIHEDRHLTVHEIAKELGISMGSCYEILTGKLNTHRISAKFGTCLLLSLIHI